MSFKHTMIQIDSKGNKLMERISLKVVLMRLCILTLEIVRLSLFRPKHFLHLHHHSTSITSLLQKQTLDLKKYMNKIFTYI